MYQKDFNEYIRIILRTKASYKILLDEIDQVHDIADMSVKQKQKLKAQLIHCDEDVQKLIDALKERGHLP
jgi:hypothetical protein